MNVQQNATRSKHMAAHAVRHGLAGTRHVPKARAAELKLIEDDLVAVHEPDDAHEMEMLRDLAVATWQLGELDRQHVERVDVQIAQSADVFDAQAQAAFGKLLANWRNSPVTTAESLTRSYLGLTYVVNLWQSIAQSLSPGGPGVSLEMAWEAVMAEAQNPAPTRVAGSGEWIMQRSLAASAEPEEALAEWLELAGARGSKNAMSRARSILSAAPDAAVSREELRERAIEKVAFWGSKLVERKADYEALRGQFGSAGAGMGLGDEAMQRDSRLANRYRVSAQNRVDKLVRRLGVSKSARMRRLQKHYEYEQREKIRKEKVDLQTARMTDDQFRRFNEQLDYNAKREMMVAQAEAEQRAWQAEYVMQDEYTANMIEEGIAAAQRAEAEDDLLAQEQEEQDEPKWGNGRPAGESGQMRIQSFSGTMPTVLDGPERLDLSISPVQPKPAVDFERELGVEPLRRPRPLRKPVGAADWDARQDLVCRHELKAGMFEEWPDELLLGQTKEVLAYLISREQSEKRHMPLAMFWYQEVNRREMLREYRA